MNTYGERLEHARAIKGMKRLALSEAAGVSTQNIGHLINKKDAIPSADTHNLLAKALGVRPDWLLYGTGSMTNDPFANPQPPQPNIHQIREEGRYYGKTRIVESIKILESLPDDALLEAVYWLKGFAAGKESEKNAEASLSNLTISAA